MIAGEKHIIEKIKVKLTTTSTSNGKELTNSFSPYFTDNVLPGIETCLDDIFRGNNKKTVRINQLKLSLNIDDVLRSKDELISQLKNILEDQLRDQVLESKDSFQRNDVEDKTQNVKVLDNELHYFEAVCFFLERGICPWWLSNEKLSSILEEKNLNSFFASHIDKIDALYAHLNSSKIAFKRFIGQFSNGILFWFLQQINSNIEKLTAAESTLIENGISYFTRNERIVFFQTLFEITDRKKNMTQNQLNQLISLVNVVINRSNEDKQVDQYEHSPWVNILSLIVEKKKSEIINALDHVSKNPVEAILESTKENEDKLELPDEGLYIDNAGIIVLHPFLKHFFTNIDLLKDDELKDKELAVQLLHYIATGNEEDWEHTLLFEKFLCNVPLDFPMSKKSLITDFHKKEVKELLEAVLDNWKALGNSSTELLQNEFLSRPGKLFQDNVSPRLVVERKTQDVLLDQLSWNISIIKLPWFKQILYATW